ncbi:GntR family transcriptional regulator [Roseovarius nubinhibens]|uniref:GntR family transcriptional regulator n=1 Tax=Roseovarius nubinhibens TaxID=314263 RepID=UPI001C09CF0A|nr:GntR family transcriptional regulator [Roseovarius nubinhibens]MBU3000802.1 GntR family transcriptional regulator [Roseovarius nubinhibens]
MLTPPMDPETLNATVYADLRVKLITGQLKPSEAVSVRKLAELYGVSTMPVREALRQLASEGALNSAARKAYRVPDLTAKQASDLFFVRGVLEGAAAELAAPRMTKRILAKLETAVGKTHACLEKRDAPGVLLANYEFHSAIYQSSDNSALALSIDRLYVQTGPWLAYGIENLVNAENWLGEHELIIEALRNSDAKTARKLMEEDAFWSVELYRRMG